MFIVFFGFVAQRFKSKYFSYLLVGGLLSLIPIADQVCDVRDVIANLITLSDEKAEYKAWGECRAEKNKSNFFENSEIISNNIHFQRQYFGEETGLHYNCYRYYSPYVVRFISKDPIGLLGGNNNYQYNQNPIDWMDPSGLSACKLNKKVNRSLSKIKKHHTYCCSFVL